MEILRDCVDSNDGEEVFDSSIVPRLTENEIDSVRVGGGVMVGDLDALSDGD